MKKRIKLVEDWCHAHKFLSVWMFAAIGAFPDIYHGVVALGWSDELPDEAKWCLRAMAAIGIAFRLIRQEGLKDRVHES